MRFLKFAVRLSPFLLAASQLLAEHEIKPTHPAEVNEQVQFSIYLPLQNSGQLDQLLADLHNPNSPNFRHWLTPQQFRSQFGANPADLARISAELTHRGFTILGTNAHGLKAQGSARAVQALFGEPVWHGRSPNGSDRLIATHPLQLPEFLTQAGAHVLALSTAIRLRPHAVVQGLAPANRYSTAGPYWFDDLKEAYDFPSFESLTGFGGGVAVVMSSDFLDTDLTHYFGHEGLTPPRVIRKPINGGAPFNPNSGASVEVSLDIQQVGGMAPHAIIYDYNIPDLSDANIMDAYVAIVEDNFADIVNSSFGGAEGFYTPAYNDGKDFTYIPRMFNDVFRHGNAQGITFFASSGDAGGLSLPPLAYFTTPPKDPPVVVGSFLPGIEIPASCPNVTAVGGTNLVTTSVAMSLESQYVRENADLDRLEPFDPYGVGNLLSGGVWQGGGGPSVIFRKPAYQFLARTGFNMRTVPDISLHMGGCPVGTIGAPPCPADRSSDVVGFDGKFFLVIGTSASSPDMAGVLALEEEHLGVRLGNVNFLIYALAAEQANGMYTAFHQGIPGDNGVFTATQGVQGYNLVTGNGTPIVRDFILDPNAPLAGTPQTPSNP